MESIEDRPRTYWHVLVNQFIADVRASRAGALTFWMHGVCLVTVVTVAAEPTDIGLTTVVVKVRISFQFIDVDYGNGAVASIRVTVDLGPWGVMFQHHLLLIIRIRTLIGFGVNRAFDRRVAHATITANRR